MPKKTAKKTATRPAAKKPRTRDVESIIDSLYAVSPNDFVRTRNDAADSLRGINPDAAKRVRALARPSAAAWALNTLARSSPREVKEYLAAGERVRDATSLAARGGGAADLRASSAAERRALMAAVEAATTYIEKEGIAVTETHRARIAGTLAAAVVDDSVRTDLLRGRLSLDLQRVGFGETARNTSPAALRSNISRSTLRAAGDIRAMEREAEQRQRSRESARRLNAEADRAEAEASRLQTRSKQAERDVERLDREAKETTRSLVEARKRLTAARKEAAGAARKATSVREKAQQAVSRTR